jgi:ribonuclease HI
MLVTLFSDASMCPDRRIGGWAAWLKSDRGALRGGGRFRVIVGDTCMAEAMAVVNGLTVGIAQGVIRPRDTVLVQTDNDAVMGVLEGRVRRSLTLELKRRRGRSRSQIERYVENRNEEIRIVAGAFSSILRENAVVVRWRHVKGHRGTEDRRSAVNTFCDRTAKGHMRIARRNALPTTVVERTRVRAERGRGTMIEGMPS